MDNSFLARLVSPFEQWGDRYFGLCVQNGVITKIPSENEDWIEYHLDVNNNDIFEIEVCESYNTGYIVWRGKIPTREVFLTIINNIEKSPPLKD